MAKPFIAHVVAEVAEEFRGKFATIDHFPVEDGSGFYVMLKNTGHGVFDSVEDAAHWARDLGLELQSEVAEYFEGSKWEYRADVPPPEVIPEAEAVEIPRLDLPERVVLEADDDDEGPTPEELITQVKASIDASVGAGAAYDKPVIDGASILEAIRDALAEDLIRQLDHDGHGNMYAVKRETNADGSVHSFSFFVGEHSILTVTITKGK